MTIPKDVQEKIEENALNNCRSCNNIYIEEGCSCYRLTAAAEFGYSLAASQLEEKEKELELMDRREVAWGQHKAMQEEEIEEYKKAAETNYEQVIHLGTIATDQKAEIERLKGLIKEWWYWANKLSYAGKVYPLELDEYWKQFKTENNL